jgi:group I intron endonuclease
MYIYTICSIQKYDGERLIYVGSTIDFEARFANHKSNCFNEKFAGYNCKLYKLIREHGWDNFVFEVIEVCDDNMTDKELLFREQFYIDRYDSKRSMNSQDAITKLDIVEYNAERYKNQRVKINARNKEWNNNNRETMNARSKEWRENNRDRFNELQRNSYRKKSLWRNAVKELSAIDI